jgi:hypothetical protein
MSGIPNHTIRQKLTILSKMYELQFILFFSLYLHVIVEMDGYMATVPVTTCRINRRPGMMHVRSVSSLVRT